MESTGSADNRGGRAGLPTLSLSMQLKVTPVLLSPLFPSRLPDREGTGAPAQQAVRDPQRSVPTPDRHGEAHRLLAHTVSLCLARQGASPLFHDELAERFTCWGQESSLPPSLGCSVLHQAVFLGPNPRPSPTPPRTPLRFAGTWSEDWRDLCPEKAESLCLDMSFTYCEMHRSVVTVR